MTHWAEVIVQLQQQNQSYCLVTVMDTQGSSPRNTGTKMVVNSMQSFATIGGGALEHQAIQQAQDLLNVAQTGSSGQHIQTFKLGQDLKQCCGGVVTLLFEWFVPTRNQVALFGAGHIGQELAPLLAKLDFQVQWFDARTKLFPDSLPSNIQQHPLTQPELEVEQCPPHCYYLIMTHDHGLDQALCEAILSRKDSLFCGLIGSQSKQLKFSKRLQQKGFSAQELSHLTCPIGLPSITGKQPMEIALSVAAQLLIIRQEDTKASAPKEKLKLATKK